MGKSYDVEKELKSIRDRMYGTQFEQDRVVIDDALTELEIRPKLAVSTREEEVLVELRSEQNNLFSLKKALNESGVVEGDDIARIDYGIQLIDTLIKRIFSKEGDS